jgi:hypothetical protein
VNKQAYRHAKIREAVVVDSFDHPEYNAWVGGSQVRYKLIFSTQTCTHSGVSCELTRKFPNEKNQQVKTPVFWSYSFYNITNPSQFLLGTSSRQQRPLLCFNVPIINHTGLTKSHTYARAHARTLHSNKPTPGRPPEVEEVGPFTFQMRTRKFNVSFSDQGRLVSYIQLTQHDYVGEPSDLQQVGYSGAGEAGMKNQAGDVVA